MNRASILLSFSLAAAFCHAQQSPWQGEWGAFTDPSASIGQRLSISECKSDNCTFSLEAHSNGPNCGTAKTVTLKLTSPTEATADLHGQTSAQSCHIQFHRHPTDILVTATGVACVSYYCTNAAASFDHVYPRRSAIVYTGLHVDECFTNASPARLATCTDQSLASLEANWRSLDEEFPLEAKTASDTSYAHTITTDDHILEQCDAANNPAACLRSQYTTGVATMTARRQAFTVGTTDRGDPAQGAVLAQEIAGRYRHRFKSGDVQGETFSVTNTMTITPVGKASIHFDIELNFYNGHTCSVSGGALYRKDGTFVFDDVPSGAVPSEQACRLAIVPTSDGVELKDLGGCKASYCGMRGGFNDEGFSFKERVN
jgi:hypothetical protein